MKTYGYDYCFAISTEEINKILINNLSNLNMEFKYSGHDKQSGSTITLNAKVLPWQIIKGGQNLLLRFSMPFSEGHLSIKGPISNNYDLSNVTVLIEVSLGWLGSNNTQETKGSGHITQLIFSPTKTTDPNNPGYVSVVNILDPNKHLDTIGMGLLRNYMIDILFENRKKINYIFANVVPQPKNVASWLNPYEWIYYYSTGKHYDALCFLCLLSKKSWPATPVFDSTILQEKNNVSILVSQESFFKQVVMPAIRSTFSSGKFSLNVNTEELCTIKNQGDFVVTTSKGKITANSFKLTTSHSGNGLTSITSGGGSLKFLFGLAKLPGASYSWRCEITNQLKYSNEMISFLSDPHSITHHDQTIHWYDWVLLVAVGITSLPGLIAFIVDSINGFSNQVNDIGIDTINGGIEASVTGSMMNLANLIDWDEQSKKFDPVNAGLDGALSVHGNLQ